MKAEHATAAQAARRERGMSMKEIAALLGVSVSSVSWWTRDIELSAEQQEALRQANPRFNGQSLGQRQKSLGPGGARRGASGGTSAGA